MSNSPIVIDEHVNESLERGEIIQLLDIYLTEWTHRDSFLWAHVYRYFYAILIFMIFPNIASYLQITMPPIMPKAFPILGLVLTVFFCYLSFGWVIRLQTIGTTYQNLINTLPTQYQRIKIEDLKYRSFKYGKFFNAKMSVIVVILLTLALFTIGIAMLNS